MIRSRIGFAEESDHRYCSYSALHDLAGTDSKWSLFSLALGNRRLTEKEAQFLDVLSAVCTAADARVWPLKLARLLGCYGSEVAGFVIPNLTMATSRLIGPCLATIAAEVLEELRVLTAEQRTATIASTKRIGGWGLALRSQDERFVRLAELVKQTGRDTLPYWHLHSEISEQLMRERSIPPNITSGMAAVFLDLGFSVRQIRPLSVELFSHMFAAHGFEAAQQQSAEYQLLPAEHIEYVGPAKRPLLRTWE